MGGHIRDRVVMVTGAGGGFGRRICEKAAALGASVVAADIDAEGLARTAAAVLGAGGRTRQRRRERTPRTRSATSPWTRISLQMR